MMQILFYYDYDRNIRAFQVPHLADFPSKGTYVRAYWEYGMKIAEEDPRPVRRIIQNVNKAIGEVLGNSERFFCADSESESLVGRYAGNILRKAAERGECMIDLWPETEKRALRLAWSNMQSNPDSDM